MTPYLDPWGSSRQERAGALNSMWPGSRDYAIPGQYAGYYADRQTRFYVRSLRRDGVYFVDFPPMLLWFESWAQENGFCP
jgi:hypothetical protein